LIRDTHICILKVKSCGGIDWNAGDDLAIEISTYREKASPC